MKHETIYVLKYTLKYDCNILVEADDSLALMGSLNSTMLCEEEVEELKSTTVFGYKEIEHLYERFQFLDKESRGYLTYNELNSIPEFYSNPFGQIIMRSIERMTDYEKITFPYFLEFLGTFSEKTDKKCRIKYLFDIFDLNGDGKLCRNVLLRIHGIMGQQERDDKVTTLLDIYDVGKKGYLDILDFSVLYESDPSIDKNMIIDFLKNLRQRERTGIFHVLFPFGNGGT